MGQYYYVVNLSKGEYLHPHKFGDGMKLMEFGNSACGTLTGLTVLLADGNNRGSGDLHSDHDIIGSWSGDRIVIAGDYAAAGKFLEHADGLAKRLKDREMNLYEFAQEEFEDISDAVIDAIIDGEGKAHPLAKMDRGGGNIRQKGEWG